MEISGLGTNKALGIIVDTNILLYVYDKIDPFWLIIENFEYKPKFFIPEIVLNELKALESKYSKSSIIQARIRLAREYLEKHKDMWELVPTNNIKGSPDEVLLDIAEKMHLIIFTNDKELKSKAKNKRIGIIFLTRKGKIIKSNFSI